MHLKDLKAFLAVADTGSVTAAANRLALTQSGVSRQIASLESDLGFALFDRVRGRLRVNRRGVAFLRHARRTIEAVDHLPKIAREMAAGTIDRVVIAATSAIAHGLLAPAIARYVRARPGLPPSVVMRSLQEIVDLGAESHYDMVLAPLPMHPQRFELLETIDFELRLVAPAALLQASDEPIELGELEGLPFISLDPFATYQESVERSFSAAGVRVNFACETSSALTALRLVELGVGCAFIDPFVAGAVRGPTVVSRRVRPAIAHAYGVFAPTSPPMTEEAKRALELVRDVAAELA